MKRFWLFWLFLAVVSCEKFPENPVNGSVFIRLDLQNRDKVLRGIPSYRTYSYTRPGIDYYPQQNERIGLGGLLVVHTPLDTYCAFDLACPNEPSPNRNTIVEVEKDGLHAVCPQCGTKYQIQNGTGIALGEKKHGLRSYRVLVHGIYEIVVSN